MGPSWGLLLLAVALGATAAARCPAPCVCDNLCAHVLCLNGSLTAIPDTIPEVGKGWVEGWGEKTDMAIWSNQIIWDNLVFYLCD